METRRFDSAHVPEVEITPTWPTVIAIFMAIVIGQIASELLTQVAGRKPQRPVNHVASRSIDR